jgi:ABC-2 type transport system permease protein
VIVHPTIVRLGVRSVFGRRRGVLLFVLPVVLVLLAVLVRALVGEREDAAQATLYGLGLVVIVPLVALLATSGLFAPEIDDGSISYLLAKPVPRSTIVLSKLLVAFACVVLFATLPVLVAALVLMTSTPSYAVGFGLAALLGGTAYAALFAWLSVRTKHAVVIGLIYLLIWEGLLGGLLSGIRWLSVSRWGAEVVDVVAHAGLVRDLPPAYAFIALGVVIVAGTWRAGARLRAFNLTGDE